MHTLGERIHTRAHAHTHTHNDAMYFDITTANPVTELRIIEAITLNHYNIIAFCNSVIKHSSFLSVASHSICIINHFIDGNPVLRVSCMMN